MDVEFYNPRREKQWVENATDGTIEAEIYEYYGVVRVFTFAGDARTEAFTRLEMWLWPCVYYARLPRAYHARWLRRLASKFSRQCHELNKEH